MVQGAKGYGFIRRDDGGDVSIHLSAIQIDGHRKLERGQRVEFSIVQDPKDPRASRVVPL